MHEQYSNTSIKDKTNNHSELLVAHRDDHYIFFIVREITGSSVLFWIKCKIIETDMTALTFRKQFRIKAILFNITL